MSDKQSKFGGTGKNSRRKRASSSGTKRRAKAEDGDDDTGRRKRSTARKRETLKDAHAPLSEIEALRNEMTQRGFGRYEHINDILETHEPDAIRKML